MTKHYAEKEKKTGPVQHSTSQWVTEGMFSFSSAPHLPCPPPTGPLTFLIAVTAGGPNLHSLPILGEGGVAWLLPGPAVPRQ